MGDQALTGAQTDGNTDHIIYREGEAGGLTVGLGGLKFGKFPHVVGHSCSYLLPRQKSRTSQS